MLLNELSVANYCKKISFGANSYWLVVDTRIVGVLTVAVIKAASRHRSNSIESILQSCTPIIVIEILIPLKVIRGHAWINPELTLGFCWNNAD